MRTPKKTVAEKNREKNRILWKILLERTERTESLKKDRERLVKEIGEKSRENNASGIGGWLMANAIRK